MPSNILLLAMALVTCCDGTALAAPVNSPYVGSLPDHRQLRALGIIKDDQLLVHGGKEIPLRDAVQSILPPSYTIRVVDSGAWAETPVGWSGGKVWTDAVQEMLQQVPDVVAEIIVGAKTVILRSRRPLLDRDGDQKFASKDTGPAKAKTELPDNRTEEPAQSQKARGPEVAWEVTLHDRTLRSVLARWAQAAGWQLNWDIEFDYPVQAAAEINGSFEEAVETVVKSVGRSDAPVAAVFYKGNRVLRVVAKGVVR